MKQIVILTRAFDRSEEERIVAEAHQGSSLKPLYFAPVHALNNAEFPGGELVFAYNDGTIVHHETVHQPGSVLRLIARAPEREVPAYGSPAPEERRLFGAVALVRDVPGEDEDYVLEEVERGRPTSLFFYGIRDELYDLGYRSGELLFLGSDHAVLYHQLIGQNFSVINFLVPPLYP